MEVEDDEEEKETPAKNGGGNAPTGEYEVFVKKLSYKADEEAIK